MSNENESQKTFEHAEAILLGLVCATSLLALAGWLFNVPILASLRSEYIPMAPVSGLIFLGLSGIWFINRRFSVRRGLRNLIRVALMCLLIIVLILAVRSFTGYGPDLERLVYPEPALFGHFLTARMSPLSVLGFFMAIPAFLFMTGRDPGQGKRTTAASLSLVVFFLSIINILGYLYGVPLFYGGTLIPVPITTAFAFLFLSLGLLLIAGPSCWPLNLFIGSSLKARLMRNIIPASMVIVLLQGFLSSVNDPWSINPAVKVAVAALVAWLIVVIIISIIAKGLAAEIERGKQAEEGLRQSEAELRALFASMHDVVLVIDRDGVYRKIAPTNPGLLVKPSKELLGKNLRDVFPSEQVETLFNVMRQVLDTKQTAQIEYDLNISKQTVRFETSISLMTEDSTLWVARDITERKRLEQEIRSLALTDELTGLYNRRGFTLLAEQEMKLAYRFKRSVLLFFGDVDDLKTINDALGHSNGDLALKEVAAILREIFREADIPARFGGDEFVVLAPDSSMENADILTNRLQTSLEARNRQGERPYHLTLSMGFARYDPEDPCTVSELIAQADKMMYHQKQFRKGKT